MNRDYVGIKVNKNTPIAKIYSTKELLDEDNFDYCNW